YRLPTIPGSCGRCTSARRSLMGFAAGAAAQGGQMTPKPTMVGEYQLVSPLGSGGMGDVYFAVSPTADRVAIKLIKRHLVTNPTVRDRFASDVERLKLVYGSRVARLENADLSGEPAWLAVEYIPGMTLREYVDQRGPLPLPLAAMTGAMLVDGLAKVHQAGL